MIEFHWSGMLLLICAASLVHTADEVVDCTNEDIVTSIFNDAIDLTYSGIIRTYENVSIDEILSTTNNEFEKKYIDARLEQAAVNGSKDLVIFTTPEFAYYAIEQSAVRITLKIAFGCGMGRERTLIFFQPILEDNYFRPEFTRDIYEIVMPTPIFAGFDLTSFVEISARDNDLTNNELVFESPDAKQFGLMVGTKNHTDAESKIFLASVTLTRIYLSLPHVITFNIIATDNGSPPLNASATVMVRGDPINHLPPIPQFERNIYNATLTNELTLEPFPVQLFPETYSEEVHFRLAGLDADWFRLNNTNESALVELVRQLERDDVKERKYLQFEIIAEHQNLTDVGRTAVFVDIPNNEEYIRFAKPLYQGSINASGHLFIENIILDSTALSTEITFQLKGTDVEFFNLLQRVNTLRLVLSDAFSMDSLDRKVYLTLDVVAFMGNKTATAAVLINLPSVSTDVGNKQPVFEKPLYVGSLSEQYELHIERITLRAETYSIETKFSLSGDDLYLFELKTRDNLIEIELQRKPIDGELSNNNTILLVVTAQNGNLRAHATVAINVESSAGSELVRPNATEIFTRRWQRGRIELSVYEQQVLQLEDIRLQQRYKVDELVFTLDGDEAVNFLIAVGTFDNITLRLLDPLPKSVMENKSQVFLQLHAKSPASVNLQDTILIFIELPAKACIPAVPTLVPYFDSSEYVFAAKPNQLGVLGVVTATIDGSNGTVHYQVVIDNEYLKQRLVINGNNGELRLLSYANPGVYYFNIIAENTATSATATVRARLNVESILQCDEQHLAVASSLLNKYIEEEVPHENIMNMTLADCSFQIVQMYPSDKEYVYINESTKMLSTIAIDRESEIFANMSQPQLQIRLKLVCANDSTLSDTLPSARAIEQFDDDIPYTRDITILRLIIVDINDNAPQFVQPATPKYLAYPENSICLELFPQHLTQVQAIDRDAGLNANLRYTMRPNEHFGIDPRTGVIYPKSTAFSGAEYTELIVVAIDREGAPDGLSTGIVLLVRRLSADYFSLLTFSGNSTANRTVLENLAQLSAETGYTITLLKQAIMPTKETTRRNRRAARAEPAVIQKAWVYAYDDNEPVKSEKLQSKLKSATDIVQSSGIQLENVETFDELGLSSKAASSSGKQFTTYIVTITLLGITCAACICFLIWRFYLRKYTNLGRCSRGSSIHCSDSITNSTANVASFVKSSTNGGNNEHGTAMSSIKESTEYQASSEGACDGNTSVRGQYNVSAAKY